MLSPPEPAPNAPRILVIRGGAIGDFLLTLPAIKLLRDNFPHARLEILGYKHIIALAEGRFYAHATRSIEYGPLSRFFIPNAELDPELVDYFGSFQQIVSYLYDPDQFFENNVRRCGVKHFLHGSPRLNDSAHAAYQLAEPLQRLALFLDEPAVELHLSAEDREFADGFLRGLPRPIVALHPGSGGERKNWLLQHWLALGDWLGALDPQPGILLVGGEADRERLAACRTAWQGLPVTVAEDLPLPRLAAVLEAADLFVGHDSGVSHLAAAAGTQCVLLFGPTDHQVWAPANAAVRIVEAPNGDLAKLPPGEVQAAVLDQLRQQNCRLAFSPTAR